MADSKREFVLISATCGMEDKVLKVEVKQAFSSPDVFLKGVVFFSQYDGPMKEKVDILLNLGHDNYRSSVHRKLPEGDFMDRIAHFNQFYQRLFIICDQDEINNISLDLKKTFGCDCVLKIIK